MFKKKNVFFIFLLCSTFLFAFGMHQEAFAVTEETPSFSITAIPAENQINQQASYFDLLVTPGATQTIQVSVKNNATVTKKIKVTPNSAYTNDSGVIEYNLENLKKDTSAPFLFSDIISSAQVVTLAAGTAETLTFTLNYPATPFVGIVQGAFRATDLSSKEEKPSVEGVHIVNEFALVLGVTLHEDLETKISPNLELEKVSIGHVKQENTVFARLHNAEPVAFGSLSIDAQIIDKKTGILVKKVAQKELEMAPNSNFKFSIPYKGTLFKAGKYRLKIIAQSGAKEWDLQRDFSISAKKAKQLNEKMYHPKKDFRIYYLIGLFILIILVVAGLSYRLGRRKTHS